MERISKGLSTKEREERGNDLDRDESLREARRILDEKGIRHLLATEGKHLVGIVTESDLLEVLVREGQPPQSAQ